MTPRGVVDVEDATDWIGTAAVRDTGDVRGDHQPSDFPESLPDRGTVEVPTYAATKPRTARLSLPPREKTESCHARA